MNNKEIKKILKYKGVTGIGYGKKIVDGKATNKNSVIVFVEKKIPKNELSAKSLIPNKIDGLISDVYETGTIEPMSVYRKKHRPMLAGISMVRVGGTACTAGIPVYKNNKTFSLVNLHCSTEFMEAPAIKTKMLQPSPFDGGRYPRDFVGEMVEHYPFSFNKENEMDSALIDMNVAIEAKTPKKGNYVPQTASLRAGDIIHKEGRTSGFTQGRVIATNVIAKVRFERQNGTREVAIFRNQIFTEPSLIFGGDSSSAVFNSRREVVGQIFAGSTSVGVITPMETIIKFFNVSLSSPLNGFIAVGRNVRITNLSVEVLTRTNLRNAGGINASIIKTLPIRTKMIITGIGNIADNHYWLPVSVI